MTNYKNESNKAFFYIVLEIKKNYVFFLKIIVSFLILGLVLNANKPNEFEIDFIPILGEEVYFKNSYILETKTLQPYLANNTLKKKDLIGIRYDQNTYIWTASSNKVFNIKEIENIFIEAQKELIKKKFNLYNDINQKTNNEFLRLFKSYLASKSTKEKLNIENELSLSITENMIAANKAKIIYNKIENKKHIKILQNIIIFLLLGIITSVSIIIIREDYKKFIGGH